MKINQFLVRIFAVAITMSASQALSAQDALPAFENRTLPERSRLFEEYGEAAEPASVFEDGLNSLRGQGDGRVDRGKVDAALDRLVQVDITRAGGKERKKLSLAWRRAAELTRQLDGPSDEMLGHLEIALSLDPENESLVRQVRFERNRSEVLKARVKEAKRVREALDRGDDPYPDIAYGTGSFQQGPAGNGGNQ